MLSFSNFISESPIYIEGDDQVFDFIETYLDEESVQLVESMIYEKNYANKVVAGKEPQLWGDVRSDMPKDQQIKAAKELYHKFIDDVKEKQGKLAKGLKSSIRGTQHAKILTDIKAIDSFVDKIVNRGKPAKFITDWLRAAIITHTQEDVNTVTKNIFKTFKVVREFDKKERGSDKKYGYYGPTHFLVDVDGVTVEIQVMTKKLWAYKGEAHKIYNEYRSLDKVDFDKMKKDMARSRRIYDLANR